MKALDRNYTH